VIPRLRTRCVNICLGPIPARVVQTPYHDIDDTGPCSRLAKQSGTTGWAEATLHDAGAIANHIVVFHLSGDAIKFILEDSDDHGEPSGTRTPEGPTGNGDWADCLAQMDHAS
jgi:hypothetical protein